MILVFIPLFTFVVYPAINSVFKLTPIRKIAIGLFIMVIGLRWSHCRVHRCPQQAQHRVADRRARSSRPEVMVPSPASSSHTGASCHEVGDHGLFLMSVSLGNFFTQVTSVIVVDSNAAAAKSLAWSMPVHAVQGDPACGRSQGHSVRSCR